MGRGVRRGSLSLGQAVEQTVRPLLRKRGFRESALVRHWAEIMGPYLARRAAPVRFAGGTLTIRVEPAFATEMQHRSAMIAERIGTTYGVIVKRIVIRQGPVHGRRHYPAVPKRSKPPTEQVRDTVATWTADVRNRPLREALSRLGETVTGGN